MQKIEERRFLKCFKNEMNEEELRYGNEGREHCAFFHIKGRPCIFCSPNCIKHRHRVDREMELVCISCSSSCIKIHGINRIYCTSCKSAWFIICKAKVHSQISYAYTHFYLKHYNDIVPGLRPLCDEDNLIGNAWEECKTARDKIEIKDASHLQKDGISYVCKLCKSELCCEANKHSLEKV